MRKFASIIFALLLGCVFVSVFALVGLPVFDRSMYDKNVIELTVDPPSYIIVQAVSGSNGDSIGGSVELIGDNVTKVLDVLVNGTDVCSGVDFFKTSSAINNADSVAGYQVDFMDYNNGDSIRITYLHNSEIGYYCYFNDDKDNSYVIDFIENPNSVIAECVS